MGEDKIFEIAADKVDVEKIMSTIRTRIEEKKKAGLYNQYNLSGISRLELEHLSSEEELLDYHLETLMRTGDIYIGDFEIVNKGGFLGPIEVLIKKIIWKLLKFYTYQLFSQQKEFNCQLTNACISLRKYMDRRFKEIHERLNALAKEK